MPIPTDCVSCVDEGFRRRVCAWHRITVIAWKLPTICIGWRFDLSRMRVISGAGFSASALGAYKFAEAIDRAYG